jgi:hypothetical protein
MAFFSDLSTASYVVEGDHVRAVGWLAAGRPFESGEIAIELADRLAQYAARWGDSVDALRWPISAGFHTCEICLRERGTGNFGVPAGRVLYVCPAMIAHYVSAHRYRPPREFLEAMAAAPLPGTPEYVSAVAIFPVLRPPR